MHLTKMIARYLILAFPVFFIISCIKDHENDTSGQLKNIDPEILPTGYILNDELKYIEYIPLKPSSQAYLSQIRKMVYHKDYFIILCFQRSAIYFYNHSGDFLFLISPKGRGPLEFSSVQDITLYDENTLLISDNELSKILQLDIPQREIVNEWRLDTPPFSITYNNNFLYIISNDMVNGSIKVVKELNFEDVKSFVKPTGLFNLIVSPNPFIYNNDTLFISVGFTDTVYYARNGNILPFASLGNAESSLSNVSGEDIKSVVFAKDRSALRRLKTTIVPSGFFSSIHDKWIIPLFINLDFLVYDRATEKAFIANSKAFKKVYLLFGAPLPMIYAYDNEGYLYSSLIPFPEFYNRLEKLPEDDQIRRAAMEGLGQYYKNEAYENPVIVKFKPDEHFLELKN